jgi:YHS domain-containing protein
MTDTVCSLVVVLASLGTTEYGTTDDKESAAKPDRLSSQRALEPFNDWIGSWRGVGQPKRGSNKGAWTEEAEWAWKIDRDTAAIQFDIKDGKQLQNGVLTFDPERKKFRLAAKLPQGESRVYLGERADDGKLVLISSDDSGNDQHRLTLQLRHEDRLLLLFEAKGAGQSAFARVAEIGYTRKGGNFASAADAGPKCIVTGGRGTIAVEYKGKTYYVCCTGCKTAFQEDAEAIIAEFTERNAKKSAEKKKP